LPMNTRLRTACSDSAPELDQHQVDPERISLFEVPLTCEAAPGLGCGVKAKPALQALARQPGVAQAWLNRSGTLAAVRWEETVGPKVRRECLRLVLALQGFAARGLTGIARESALSHFTRGADWYRADALDQLSEEEAAIHRRQTRSPRGGQGADAARANRAIARSSYQGAQARTRGAPSDISATSASPDRHRSREGRAQASRGTRTSSAASRCGTRVPADPRREVASRHRRRVERAVEPFLSRSARVYCIEGGRPPGRSMSDMSNLNGCPKLIHRLQIQSAP
jgi:hypothetical protein